MWNCSSPQDVMQRRCNFPTCVECFPPARAQGRELSDSRRRVLSLRLSGAAVGEPVSTASLPSTYLCVTEVSSPCVTSLKVVSIPLIFKSVTISSYKSSPQLSLHLLCSQHNTFHCWALGARSQEDITINWASWEQSNVYASHTFTLFIVILKLTS